jgi:hypothetical protein
MARGRIFYFWKGVVEILIIHIVRRQECLRPEKKCLRHSVRRIRIVRVMDWPVQSEQSALGHELGPNGVICGF